MSTLVSVVVPTFNSERYLVETLQSIARQTHPQLEVLVTDDASTDGTVEIVREMTREDSRFTLFVQTSRRGPAAARNRSIANASGRFLAFCDSDDLWGPDKLERQIPFTLEHGAAISFTSYEVIDDEGRPTGRVVDLGNRLFVEYADMLRKRATMGCSTVMVDRLRVPDLRMPDLRTGQDYATWLALLRQGHPAYCLDVPLTRYRIRPGSISRNKYRKAKRQWQIYREVEGLGPAESIWYFLHYAYRAVMRR